MESEGRFGVKWGKANALVWSGLVWSHLHLISTHLIILSHPIILHPTHPSLLTLFRISLHPSHSILPYPIPSHSILCHPTHLISLTPSHPIFCSSCPILPYSIPLHLIPSHSSYSTHPIPPHASSVPCHPTLFHLPPPPPHLLWTSMPAIPRQSCSCQGHGPIGGGGHLEQFLIQDVCQ